MRGLLRGLEKARDQVSSVMSINLAEGSGSTAGLAVVGVAGLSWLTPPGVETRAEGSGE